MLVTAAGKDIVERARRLLADADALFDAGKRASDPFVGRLRVGVIPTIAPYALPSIAPRLRKRFPELTVAWREDKTEVLAAALQSGELDAALLELEADVGDVDREIIAEDAFVLATRPGDPLGKKATPIQTSELKGAEVLLLDDGHCFRDQALDVCTMVRAREAEFRATSLTTLVQMVAGGSGVTLLPELAVPTEAARAGLSVRPIASSRAHRTIALGWRKRSPLAPALHEIGSVMRDAFPHAQDRRRAG